MKISTIIPVYNAEKYIGRCIESILAQGIDEQEIICVDDGSTDNSLSILREYESAHNNIHVLTQKNSFAGTARNHGLSIAKGEYVHFMDADDYVLPGAYLKVYETARRNDADYVKARNNSFDMQSGNQLDNNFYTLRNYPEDIFERVITFKEYPDVFLDTSRAPWTSFVRRSFLEKHGIRFDSLRCVNDHSFYYNVVCHADRLVLCDCYMVNYQVNNKDSLMGIRSDNFVCNLQSFRIVRGVVSDMPDELYRRILGWGLKSLVRWYYRLDGQKKAENETILRQFFKELNWDEIDRCTLSDSIMNPIYELLGMRFSDVVEYQIKNTEALEDYFKDIDEVIIYGAGRVCFALIQYLAEQNYNLNKIFCIAVSNKLNNPDNILGIPVCTFKDIDLTKVKEVVIATFENVQLPIYHMLSLNSSCKIKAVTNYLYAEMRRMNRDLSVDILQNALWIRSDLQKVASEITDGLEQIKQRLQSLEDINNIEGCT